MVACAPVGSALRNGPMKRCSADQSVTANTTSSNTPPACSASASAKMPAIISPPRPSAPHPQVKPKDMMDIQSYIWLVAR